MELKRTADLNPFVKITVTSVTGAILFCSSDPKEIEKQNLNGLEYKSLIDIDSKEYIVENLSISIFSMPITSNYGANLFQEHRGREIPYIVDIKIMAKE